MSDSDYSPLPEDIGNIADYYYATDDIILSNDTEKDYTGTTPLKMKEITIKTIIEKQSGFRITFDMRPSDAKYVYGQIYKNGVPYGTLHSLNIISTVTYTQDFTGPWNQNDTIELWGWAADAGVTVKMFNFRIKGAKTTFINTLT